MAKNTDIKGLLDDGVDNNRIDNTPETDEIKYKEIKMPSDSPRDGSGPSGHISLASPINFDIPRVNPSDGNYRHNNSVFDDENLADRDIVPCPTCRGTGTIHADDSSLVALIPVKDERLRPKRTKLKIIIAIVITLLICGITLYFLFPRSPTLRLISVTQYNASIPDEGDAYILFENKYVVDNNNYVSVDLTSISLSVTYRKVQVAGPDPFYRFKSTTVDIRSSTNLVVYIKTTYRMDTPSRDVLKYICMYRSYLHFYITTELQASFLFHTETISTHDDTYVQCYYNGTTAA